jgi:hypothetical protein
VNRRPATWLQSRPFFASLQAMPPPPEHGPGPDFVAARPRSATAAANAGFVAIDFGTSNSAVALPRAEGGVQLVTLENGLQTMPTAVLMAA